MRAGLRRYGSVWSVRPVRWVFTGTLIARMAQTMMPLAMLLLFRQRTGSFAAAGSAVAVFGLAFVVGGPVTARLADRHGARVLFAAGGVNAAAVILLALTASLVVSWIAVAVAGLSVPPLTSALRVTIAARLTGDRDRAAAFSMDAIATEVLFVAGPAVVSAAVALGGSADALVAAGGLVVIGCAVVTVAADRNARQPAPGTAGSRHRGAGQAAVLAPWLAIAAAQMGSVGFVEVAATARVIQLGHPASAGTVLAFWAVGSAAGGLVYGSRDWPGTAVSQLRVLLLLLAVGFTIVTVSGSLVWLYPLMFTAGLSCAPAVTTLTTSFSNARGIANRAESYAWLASSASLGGSAGYAVAGLMLVHATITTTILAGAALPILAIAIVPR
jgi:hypothetical protein